MRVLSNSVLVGVLLVGLSACGPGIEDDAIQFAREKWSIIGGQADTSLAHRAVVAVYFRSPVSGGICTGTLIGDDAILSAAHCCDSNNPSYYQILFGLETTTATSIKVSHVWQHPEYDFPEHDICLLRLKGQAPDGIQPLTHLPASLALTEDNEGEEIVFVGYGLDGDYLDPARGLGQRLVTTATLDWVCDNAEDCSGIGFPTTDRMICYDNEKSGTCQGDSGGPAFVVRDGVEYVAGITSYNDGTCMTYGCSLKVDQYQDYIDGFLNSPQRALGLVCEDDYDCASGFCADGVCCDYACKYACEACNVAGSEGHCVRDTMEAGCTKESGGCNAVGQTGSWYGLGWMLGLLGFVLSFRFSRRVYNQK